MRMCVQYVMMLRHPHVYDAMECSNNCALVHTYLEIISSHAYTHTLTYDY